MRLRFPRAARLATPAEFQRVKLEGRSFHGKFLILSVLKSPTLAQTRIGLITSRRVGNAVVRNRIRRRLRELVRTLLLPRLGHGAHVVVIARSAAANAPFQELQNEWLRLAKRAALLGDP